MIKWTQWGDISIPFHMLIRGEYSIPNELSWQWWRDVHSADFSKNHNLLLKKLIKNLINYIRNSIDEIKCSDEYADVRNEPNYVEYFRPCNYENYFLNIINNFTNSLN